MMTPEEAMDIISKVKELNAEIVRLTIEVSTLTDKDSDITLTADANQILANRRRIESKRIDKVNTEQKLQELINNI